MTRPYLETFEQRIVVPSVAFGRQSYETYGAPRVQQANAYGWDQWETSLKPQLHAGQAQVKQQYDKLLAPQVAKIFTITEPYYTASRENVLQVYKSRVLLAYTLCRPYMEKVYAVGQEFAVEIGIPYAKSAWASTVILVERTIWPQLRILYGENVEPQLVRIGQRLGRYRDGKKLKATMDEMESSLNSISRISSISSPSSSVESEASVSDSTESSSIATEDADALTKQQEEQQVREKIASDLKNWQEKFAKAADKGTEDLEQRIKEITDRQMENQVEGVGEALIVQLEEASKSEIKKLKKTVAKLVMALPEEPESADDAKALEELAIATRQSGLDVKNKAQALRRWKEDFDVETQSLVSAASESTLEVIDNIRDLGLQEIGMRWAFMEGVTYKDWSKYHSVKKTFDEWRQEVEGVATEHEGFQKAKEAAGDLESRGMAIAEDTARELARLKEVGKWKIQALDRSDDFSNRAETAKLGQKALDQAKEQATEVASSASSIVIGGEPGIMKEVRSSAIQSPPLGAESDCTTPLPVPSGSDVLSSVRSNALPKSSALASESVSSMASKASTKIYGGAMAQKVGDQKPILDDLVDDDVTYSEKIQSIIEQAGEKYSDITDAVNEALGRATVTQGTVESVTSLANEQYSSALAAASNILYGTEQGRIESMTSVASDRYAEAVAAYVERSQAT